jgi:hypothetical protein
LRKLVSQFARQVRDERGFFDRDRADQLSRHFRAGVTRRLRCGGPLS